MLQQDKDGKDQYMYHIELFGLPSCVKILKFEMFTADDIPFFPMALTICEITLVRSFSIHPFLSLTDDVRVLSVE